MKTTVILGAALVACVLLGAGSEAVARVAFDCCAAFAACCEQAMDCCP